jgi:hypothetical protein
LKSLALRLWDEEGKTLTGYRQMKLRRKESRNESEPPDGKR